MANEESTHNKLIEKVSDSVNALNITFARVEGKIDAALELKKDVGQLAEKLDKLNNVSTTTSNRLDNATEDIQILFRKSKERDLKSDADRKWLIGTVIAVAGIGLAVLNLLIK